MSDMLIESRLLIDNIVEATTDNGVAIEWVVLKDNGIMSPENILFSQERKGIEFANWATIFWTSSVIGGVKIDSVNWLYLNTWAWANKILSENDMVSNDPKALCTQESIKTYVDNKLSSWWSGTYVTWDSRTVTVTNGIITDVS